MYQQPELKKRMGPEPRAELEDAFFKVITAFPISERYTGIGEHRSRLRYFSSSLIGQFVRAIELQVPSSQSEAFVKIQSLEKLQVRVLKALTWFYVIYNPALATQQYGQRKNNPRTLRNIRKCSGCDERPRKKHYPFCIPR